MGVSGNSLVPLQRLLSWLMTDQLRQKVSIGVLPTMVLLEIFSLYVDQHQHRHSFDIVDDASLYAWHTLVHVCQQWRQVVFASPRSLNLRLLCTNKMPVRKLLDIWPDFPIVVSYHTSLSTPLLGVANIVAALKCADRVCEINLCGIPNSLLKRFVAMKDPFPALASLQLSPESGDNDDGWLPFLPNSFLGGIAPRLRSLDLRGIRPVEPQKLFLSAKDLVTLRLEDIPYFGYISPEEMLTWLSMLTKLEEVALGFRSSQPDLYQTSQPPSPATFTILSALTSLRFRGDRWYLEALISRIGLPLLDNVDITFFCEPEFNAPLLGEFLGRIRTFEALRRADITFYDDLVDVTLSPPDGINDCITLKLGILCNRQYHQISCLTLLCGSCLPLLRTLEHLHISMPFPLHRYSFYMAETYQWLEMLHPFRSVKNLHLLSEDLALCVARALGTLSDQELMELLPSLQDIFLPRPQPSEILVNFAHLIIPLRVSGRSISVHYWKEGNRVVKLHREIDN